MSGNRPSILFLYFWSQSDWEVVKSISLTMMGFSNEFCLLRRNFGRTLVVWQQSNNLRDWLDYRYSMSYSFIIFCHQYSDPLWPLFLTIMAATSTSLDYLKQTGTVVVSDSGDFECKRASLTLISPRSFLHSQLSMSTSLRFTLIHTALSIDTEWTWVGCDDKPIFDLGRCW